MRSKLRKPVISAGFAAMLLLPATATAQDTPALDGLFACEAIADAAEQLACFRTETTKLRAPSAPIPSPVPPRNVTPPPVMASPPPTPQKAAEPEFAPLPKEKSEAKAPKSRTLAIQSTSRNAKGNLRFTLENGEVWLQIERARLRFGDDAPDMLTIKRRSFGSFTATVNGKRPSFRIRRIR